MINDADFINFYENIKHGKIINNHKEIKEKLNYLKKINNIPNIIFHGENNSGKKLILNYFIDLIYNNDQKCIHDNVLTINCSFNKGIKFIREDLKFFCKTIINYDEGKFFKSIILINADKLTIDAQSALRRCIEIYSHNTRFFIIVENKNKLLKPIISRFASILIIDHNIENINDKNINIKNINNKINLILQKCENKNCLKEINNITNILYDNGYSSICIFNYFKNNKKLSKTIQQNIKKYELLLNFLTIKNEIKNEKLLIFYLLKNIFIRCNDDLENIDFI